MPTPKVIILLDPLNPSSIEAIDVTLFIENEDGGALKTFQALGRLHREMDAIYGHDPKYVSLALNYYHALFCEELAWPQYIPLCLLFIGQNWNARMCLAWYVLSKEEQVAALEVDYTKFPNYWPNFDFLKPSWRAQVDNNCSVQQFDNLLKSCRKLH